ncbi:TPA: DUF4177 domain-containing protein [Clostridium perfringens]|uniref:DUF4177 domain-containing protein n=2 Tax=Clostridium perfringens TaxID=1502 RepID=A0AAW9K8B1_CLOPF|nr:DUF4177 domain-containing protein [Clostridium perfringens]EDT13293.1 conserved hypothetical protein [Clostridium perfringens E str. JGS1987]EGT0015244.1 DUF4177 domain-containing protein [Clostridium perfringens]EGT3606632.1 DUF4177 domain-containing protein [Clostridium perfringens]EGT4138980.1 DUF4177 domain-containing protein [Clostridium perfringens]EGT4145056.1 DUF4177 domain-containing protein [Clostridium perfringens]
MYEYKFINVPVDKSFKCKRGDSFEKCKDIIKEEAKSGWRLKQIVTPINEKTGVNVTYAYEIIFERKVENNV